MSHSTHSDKTSSLVWNKHSSYCENYLPCWMHLRPYHPILALYIHKRIPVSHQSRLIIGAHRRVWYWTLVLNNNVQICFRMGCATRNRAQRVNKRHVRLNSVRAINEAVGTSECHLWADNGNLYIVIVSQWVGMLSKCLYTRPPFGLYRYG